MNRPLWAAAVVVVLIAGIIVGFHSPLTGIGFGVSDFSRLLEQLKEEVASENWESAEQIILQMEESLDSSETLIKLINGTEPYYNVEQSLQRVKGSVAAQDTQSIPQALAELTQVWRRAVSL